LETRTLLSTYPVNGTNGADTWHISADAGVVTINGSTSVIASTTDVTVNGFDGNDTLYIDHNTIPITFNGGNNNDTLVLSSTGELTSQINASVTFNAGAGIDSVQAHNEAYTPNVSYVFFNTFLVWETAALTWDSSLESITLQAGEGHSTTTIDYLSEIINVQFNGGTGSDAVSAKMNGPNGALSISGGGGAGADSLSISDDVEGPVTYSVSSGAVSRTGRNIFHDGFETVQLQAASLTANTINVTGGSGQGGLTLIGGSDSDIFNLTGSEFPNVAVSGGGGSADSLVIDDRNHIQVISRTDTDATTFTRYWGGVPTPAQVFHLSYAGIEAWTYYGKNSTTSINVYGIPSSIPAGQQATIIGGANADTITLHPHDVNGNLTINGNLGVGGGGGGDKVLIDDAGATNGIDYVFLNTFGAGTQNINGLGTRGFGAGSDVETIEIHGGDGVDSFKLNTWQSGAALIVNSGGGLDTFEVSPTAHNLPAAITSMSFFSYDGGSGNDHFDVYNDNSTATWTVTRTSTQLSYSGSTGYFIVVNLSHLGYMFASGGTQNDAYLIRSTPAADMNNDFYGAAGNDTYTFGNAGLTSGIASYCNVNGFGGTDSIVIDDTADTIGRGFHINSGFINAVPGDTLFSADPSNVDAYGVVVPSGVTGSITIKLGSGSDIINFAPVAIGDGTYSLQANSPTFGTGDQLRLAFAGVTSPVLTPQGTGNGAYTFGNRAPMSYSGIETRTTDNIAPTFLGGQYNYDAISGSSVDLRYSENVFPGLYNTHFDLYNLTTSTSIPYGIWAYTYDATTNTVHYTFPGLPGGVLPAGSYQTSSSRVTDAIGNTLVGSVDYNFIWIGGDDNARTPAAADTFRVDTDPAGTMTRVFHNDDSTPAITATAAGLDLVFIAGGEDDDSVLVDTSNGNPYAASGIVVDGGEGVDSLGVLVTDLIDNVAFGSSTILIDGGDVAHSAFEAFAYTGSASEHYVALAVDAGSVTVNGTDRFESLSIADGAAAIAQPGNASALVVHALSISGTGVLDLADNALICTGASVPAVQALLAAGFNQGHWNGAGGINSSSSAAAADPLGVTALGLADNTILHRTEFAGVSELDGTEILVKYTYYGDANLDGKVDIGDLGLLAGAWQQSSGKTWFDGDFTYDGAVNIGDLGLLAGNWQKGVGNPL
jgi:hypothetical protein